MNLNQNAEFLKTSQNEFANSRNQDFPAAPELNERKQNYAGSLLQGYFVSVRFTEGGAQLLHTNTQWTQ